MTYQNSEKDTCSAFRPAGKVHTGGIYVCIPPSSGEIPRKGHFEKATRCIDVMLV